MARLTRLETQRRNRELVVESARRLFLRDGYQATGIAAIADEAGFSTGVVYSNFSGKAQLGLVVLQDIQREQAAALNDVLAGPEPPLAKLDRAKAWAEAALDSGWPRFELEFALDARTESALVTAEAERAQSATRNLAEALGGLVPAPYAALLPMDAMAEVITNVAIGVAVRRVIDPSVRVDALFEELRTAVRALGI